MTNEAQVLEMVVIEPVTVMAAYTNGQSLDFAIEQVRAVVSDFDHDMSTVTSRKRTASLAMKVAKVKTGLDAMGKDLTTQWKEKAKKVDGSRKAMREALDELKIEARKPLSDWEDQQEKEKADREALEAAEKLAAQIESDHDYALLMNEKIEREAIEAKAEAERQAKAEAEFEERLRKDREANIAQEAAERATREANEKALMEKAEADRNAAAQEVAVKAAQEAEQRAKKDHEEAIKKAEAQRLQAIEDSEAQEATRAMEAKAATERAEREKIEAIRDAELKAEREAKEKEDARLAEEQRLLAEQKKREENQTHRRKFNNEILADLMAAGLDESTGKSLIKLIATGKISHTKISY